MEGNRSVTHSTLARPYRNWQLALKASWLRHVHAKPTWPTTDGHERGQEFNCHTGRAYRRLIAGEYQVCDPFGARADAGQPVADARAAYPAPLT